MNIFKNLTSIFHAVIIASLVLSISGCGYKDAPFYSEEVSTGDGNVKFIMKKKDLNNDNNESCQTR